MAFLRRTIRTACRFNRDSTDTATIEWYKAAPGAPVLPYPSKIRPLSDVYFPWVDTDVGEVYGAERRLNHKVAPPFVAGQHICGTREDFTRGGTLDSISPPVEYDANWIPLCCEPALVAEGGVASSGTADLTVVPPTTYTNSYGIAGGFHLPVCVVSVTINQQEWTGSSIFGTIRLRSPIYPGHTGWTLEMLGSLFCTWSYPSSWNGHGEQEFTVQSGGCSDWFVASIP